ncbi:MAG: peptide MFS transporter [Phycisphaerae bacterium]
MSTQPANPAAPTRSGEIFGHPRGLYVLFFTELWERFSFYGMKTLLMLYMINHFFWSQEDASGLLGTYAALAYGLPVVGGFVADRWLGAKRAVVVGAILLTIGHFLMAFEPLPFFYTALGFIIAGVGLLKPNVSTQVGALYKPGDPRRDGAFTIFYMGINLGALIGPLICDWLRVHYGYHYGFGAAGVGMVAGLIVYIIGQRKLVEFNQDLGNTELNEEAHPTEVHPPHVVRDRIIVLLVVFAFIILFWTAFEQSPNAMLVWADKHTNLQLASTTPPPVTLSEAEATTTQAAGGWGAAIGSWFRNPSMTSGQTQSFNPFFIITLAPVAAFFWVWLDRRKRQPSTPTKMVMGLALVAVAFGVMWPAAHLENGASSAALSALPDSLAVDDDGHVYTAEQEKRTYYGAKRLRYDAKQHQLTMHGVLTDLDRFRLLAETAPPEVIEAVKAFAERTAEKDAFANESPTIQLEDGPATEGVLEIEEGEGQNRKTVLRWDPATKTLTALSEVKERARTEFLAAAAEPAFKAAVDYVYLTSATFRVSVWWLILFFMVLTMGELCLSPVGLSLVTKLAPAKHVGLFMGGWFLATAIAEKLAQVFGAWWGQMPPTNYFLMFVVMCGVGAALMALLIRPLKRMMHGVQ